MITPITDNSLSITGATELGFEKTWRPSRRWNLGLDVNNVAVQLQQVKTATSASAAGTSGNQGQAQAVKNLRITRRSIGGGQVQVSVAFTPNSNDRFFQGVAVSLTQGGNTPLQVAFGKISPVTFTVSKSNSPSAISVQSVGSLGDTSIGDSPSRALPRLNL
jgi:hypothetical protein